MLQRVQCAAVGITLGRGLDDRLAEAHIAPTRIGATIGGAATRGQPRAVGARVFQVRIRVAIRTVMGTPGITGAESSSRRCVVHGELWRMVHRVTVDISGVGII